MLINTRPGGVLVLLVWLVIGLAAPLAGAQSVTEAKFVLRDIKRWLPGAYDNEPQIFVETAFGAGEDGNHPWRHLVIEALDGSGLGDAVFLINIADRGAPELPDEWRLVAFFLDEPMRAVRMARYSVPAQAGESGDNAAIVAAAKLSGDGCPVYWRQGPGHLYGAVSQGWCTPQGRSPAREERVDWTLTADDLWINQAYRDPQSGVLLAGRVDEVPLRFSKVKWYQCFINIFDRDGDGLTTINPFTMHDGGDVYSFRTKESPARTIDVLLRRSMWTSRSGNNFVPLLQMWVYQDGNREEPIASSWADAHSGRVGWDAHHLGGGRCKIPTPPPFQ